VIISKAEQNIQKLGGKLRAMGKFPSKTKSFPWGHRLLYMYLLRGTIGDFLLSLEPTQVGTKLWLSSDDSEIYEP
jgi:hypothetical protein